MCLKDRTDSGGFPSPVCLLNSELQSSSVFKQMETGTVTMVGNRMWRITLVSGQPGEVPGFKDHDTISFVVQAGLTDSQRFRHGQSNSRFYNPLANVK